MHGLDQLLDSMWKDYCQLNPAARKIYDLLTAQGEEVLNDHIALRTFDHPSFGIENFAKFFKAYGYQQKGEYHFKEKKLFAVHFEHSSDDYPKIFISELQMAKVSDFIQKAVDEMAAKMPKGTMDNEKVLMSGRPWPMSFKTYTELAKESEYASWVAAIGFRPNHFTVNINRLKKFSDIRVLNSFIAKNGYALNSSGGEVKGSPEVLLEQSSTMAKEIPVSFSDGVHNIPGCYYEFAKRYALPGGSLYQGFVAQSADKIFESTNRSP